MNLRLKIVLAALLLSSPGWAVSTTPTLLTTTWQDLGAGPIQVQTSGPAFLSLSDTVPASSAGGFKFDSGQQPFAFCGTTHVYARVAGGKAVAQVAPATCPGSGTATTQAAAEQGSSAAATGIAPAVTQSGTSVVGKSSQGNLYSAYAVNATATAGYLACINAAAVPAANAAITPVDVATLGGAAGATASINYGAGPPNAYSAGVVCLTTTSLTTYAGTVTSFMQARTR